MDTILDFVMMILSQQIVSLTLVMGIYFCNFLLIFIIIATLEVTEKLNLLALPLISVGVKWALEPTFQQKCWETNSPSPWKCKHYFSITFFPQNLFCTQTTGGSPRLRWSVMGHIDFGFLVWVRCLVPLCGALVWIDLCRFPVCAPRLGPLHDFCVKKWQKNRINNELN